jgi:glucose/mannose-6-phosphate isomerase
MLDRIAEVGTEFIRAWRDSDDLVLPPRAESARSVLVAGMGGSATGGDYFAALCAGSSEIPVSVFRGYALPYFVGERSLIVVSSYSGNTEESLTCYDDAWKRGAAVLALTTGGKLAERAEADGVPVYRFSYAAQPRAAIAWSLAPLLRLGARLGLCPVDTASVESAARLHETFVQQQAGPMVPASQNGPKQLAEALHGRIPLVLGAEHLAPVASRFKNQLAENAKMIGAADIMPEANHNLIVGLGTGASVADRLSLVTLESPLYDERVQRRFDVTAAMFEETGIPVHRIAVAGKETLDHLLIGTAWGDYVSCYLAFLNGLDPSPVPQIDRLKAALAG